MLLTDRNIVVTGAGQGIGRAISDLVIELGGVVTGVDLNSEGLEAAKDHHGVRFYPLTGSVTDPDFSQSVVESSVAKFGAIHGLVNNAGITRPAMFVNMSAEEFKDVLDVHVVGSFYFSQAVGRHMIARNKEGHKDNAAIVNISSDAGRRGTIGQVNYSSAKSALYGMTMSTAREWSKYGIRANSVCFGAVETSMTENIRSDEKLSKLYLSQIPLGRWSTAEEASIPVCFLLSEGASYITGQVLSVNGGYNMSV